MSEAPEKKPAAKTSGHKPTKAEIAKNRIAPPKKKTKPSPKEAKRTRVGDGKPERPLRDVRTAKEARAAKEARIARATGAAKPAPASKGRTAKDTRTAKDARTAKDTRAAKGEGAAKAERTGATEARAKESKRARQERQAKAPRERGFEEGGFERRAIEPDLGDLDGFRVGYVALVGRPNVGKSTILNQLLGQKLAATTHKPQTTRKNLLGILHPKGAQLLMLDTPGWHKAEGSLNRYMVEQSRAAIADADVIAYVIEARKDAEITPGNEQLLELLRQQEKPVVLLVNKIDELRDKTALLPLIQRYHGTLGERIAAVVPVSAVKKIGLEDAVREIALALPKGEPLFPDDEVTDQSERNIVAEFIREKVMLETKEELPYATAVSIDLFEDGRPRLVRIMATIHVEKDSQKAIVIGARGARLKEIGTRARLDIEHLVGSKVFLELNVRVTSEWSESPQALDMLGYGVER